MTMIGNRKKIEFRRSEYSRYKKLRRHGWRKPKGIHNKMKKYLGGKSASPSIGHARMKALKGVHPSGYREVLVENPEQLATLNKETEAVRISGSVSARKAEAILEESKKLELKVLNPRKMRVREEEEEETEVEKS
jgi:large subunit ribosomal protein L32e